MERIDIYCPQCKKKWGKDKKLLEVYSNARGIISPWCKVCHCNVDIDLDKLINDSAI